VAESYIICHAEATAFLDASGMLPEIAMIIAYKAPE